MKIQNLAGFRKIDDYVEWKLGELEKTDRSFPALYRLMFSERENILFESSEGYRIKRTTYGECRDKIERLAPGLASLLSECPQGSAVGLFLENGVLWIEFYWAILRAGYCPLLLNSRLGKDALEDALRRTNASAVTARSPPYPKRSRAGQSDCTPCRLARNVRRHISHTRLSFLFEQMNDAESATSAE